MEKKGSCSPVFIAERKECDSFLDLVRCQPNTTLGVEFNSGVVSTLNLFPMNSPKEPEPDPGGRGVAARPGNDVGRILKMEFREGEGYVRAAMREEFISG